VEAPGVRPLRRVQTGTREDADVPKEQRNRLDKSLPFELIPGIMGRTVAMKMGLKQVALLEEIVARSLAPAGLVRRARVVLLSAAGVSGREIAVRLDLSPEQVSRIRARLSSTSMQRSRWPQEK
jgi:Homeodomain-like domain